MGDDNDNKWLTDDAAPEIPASLVVQGDAQVGPAEPVEPVDLAKHRYGCVVCKRDDVYEIEQAYLAWHSYRWMYKTFGVRPDYLARHVAAVGLDKRRSDGLHRAVGRIVQCGLEGLEPGSVSVDQMIRAIEAAGKLERKHARRHGGGIVPEPTVTERTWEQRITERTSE